MHAAASLTSLAWPYLLTYLLIYVCRMCSILETDEEMLG